MADSLPLIPEKGGAQCGDVRRVLRHVLRDAREPTAGPEDEGRQYSAESAETELRERETELRRQYARRLARPPPRNKYRLHPPALPATERPAAALCRSERMFIQRKDLFPSIEQNAGRETSLWVKNTLKGSSCEMSGWQMEVADCRLTAPRPLRLHQPPLYSDLSLSIGVPQYYVPPAPAPVPPESLPPEYVVCIPAHLDFINFTVGELQTRTLRLVNISRMEVKLSLRPPARRELRVELRDRLRVTSGAASELRVHFTPRDVRALRDELLVRVSLGRSLRVPIACYMQPPVLYILVPHVTSSLLSCVSNDAGAVPVTAGSVLDLGARLLGAVHLAPLVLRCGAAHAAFFLLPEEAWTSMALRAVTQCGAVRAGSFTARPACWRGGGTCGGAVWCRAARTGLHEEALRVLCSTAVVRPLHLLADSLYFRPDHLTIIAQDKDYDICSDDDPACEYYVHLGTAFPNGCLSKAVQLVNHSPVTYTYYWRVRPWGVCSCLQEERQSDTSFGPEDEEMGLCVGALEAQAKGELGESDVASLVVAEPARGGVCARGARTVHVCAPDAGPELGVQRAVLMLILTNIPRESFPPDYEPMIVKTETIEGEAIPGEESWTREVCEVVGAQMEVWWEVAPLRFVLNPPVLFLPYSRRVKSVSVCMFATQTSGAHGVDLQWGALPALPAALASLVPPAPSLSLVHSIPIKLRLPLPARPARCQGTDLIELVAPQTGCRAACTVLRQCSARAPRLSPARAWLGVVPPCARMRAVFNVCNDTHIPVKWSSDVWRWIGERRPLPACAQSPCETCHQRACACRLLRPTSGALPHAANTLLHYEVDAPGADKCVATLIQVSHSSDDEDEGEGDGGLEAEGKRNVRSGAGAGTAARAALVAYRVLAPRLLLRVIPCHGDKHVECSCCCVDSGGRRALAAVLRPARALTAGRRTCYRLRVTNLTPLPTTVHWRAPPDESENALKVIFCPNDFDVGCYAEIEIKVVVEARRVCARRVRVLRARVLRALAPLYLLIDAAIAGLEVVCEMPIGGAEKTDAFVTIRRSQKEVFPGTGSGGALAEEPGDMFAAEDLKRAVRQENICRCKFELKYIPPPPKLPRPPPARPEDYPPVEIVWEPPPLTRVCECYQCSKPMLPEESQPCCLQFWSLPLRTVASRRVTLRNVSPLTARWRVFVRHHVRLRCNAIHKDAWAMGVGESGMALQVSPARGILAGGAAAGITARVYADCWGVYHDQILIQIDHLEPIVVDVWVEAVGSPLQLVLAPAHAPDNTRADDPPVMWMSSSEPERTVRVRNVSRVDVAVHAYLLRDHEDDVTPLPFRLYLRMFDIPPISCPCVSAFDSADSLPGEQSASAPTEDLEPGTGFGIYLTADLGVHDDTYYTMMPDDAVIPAGGCGEWRVRMQARDAVAPHTVLLRALPVANKGSEWWRPEPAAVQLQLVRVTRAGALRVSQRILTVRLCALDLPHGDVLRVRKRFRAQNVGDGDMRVSVRVDAPWSLVQGAGRRGECGLHCEAARQDRRGAQARTNEMEMCLQPRSSTEMTVEVSVNSASSWPESAGAEPPRYSPRARQVTSLHFYDDHTVLQTVSLVLELEYPIISVEPRSIELGYVCDGDTRKTYFTVSHSSRTDTLQLCTQWEGDPQYVLWPPRMRLEPGDTARVYVQYTAKWNVAPAEGWANVFALCGAGVSTGGPAASSAGVTASRGGWCRARVAVRALLSRDYRCHLSVHDHTDDPHLVPPL